jgi:hypothetical protein
MTITTITGTPQELKEYQAMTGNTPKVAEPQAKYSEPISNRVTGTYWNRNGSCRHMDAKLLSRNGDMLTVREGKYIYTINQKYLVKD